MPAKREVKLSAAQLSAAKKLLRPVSQQRRAYPPRRPRQVMSGRGAYYVRGSGSLSAKLPYLGKAEASLEAGYMSKDYHLKGHGSYLMEKIKHNTFIRGEPPEIRNMRYREGAVVIRHREYIGDVISSATSGAFNIQTYPINPGLAQTFPWLSQIAIGFEEYVISGMVFEFRSTASDAIASSTNLALGTVGLCTQYDPLNPTFTNMQQLLAYEYAQQCKVSENALHMIECAKNQTPINQLYVRGGLQPANSDIRLYDWGVFSIATSGLQGTNVNIGQIWVSYEVCFLKPKLSTQSILGGGFYNQILSGVSTSNMFGTTVVAVSPENTLAITNTGLQINFPSTAQPVSYMVQLNYTFSSGTWGMASQFGHGNCVVVKYFNGNAYFNAPANGTASVTSGSSTFIVSTLGNNAATFLQFSTNLQVGSGAVCQMTIDQIAYINPATYGSV